MRFSSSSTGQVTPLHGGYACSCLNEQLGHLNVSCFSCCLQRCLPAARHQQRINISAFLLKPFSNCKGTRSSSHLQHSASVLPLGQLIDVGAKLEKMLDYLKLVLGHRRLCRCLQCCAAMIVWQSVHNDAYM
jgi:hypothetical protein